MFEVALLVREAVRDERVRGVLADYLADKADANINLVAIELMMGEAVPDAPTWRVEDAIRLLRLTHVERLALVRAARAVAKLLEVRHWNTVPLSTFMNITETQLRSTGTVGKKTLMRLHSALARAGLTLKQE